jgi:hypothetical protein
MVRPFLSSIQEALPNSETVLFVKDQDETFGENTKTTVPLDHKLRTWLRKLPRGQLTASKLFIRLSRFLPKAIIDRRSQIFKTVGYGVAVARYFWYRDYLRTISLDSDTYLILSDTRDVILQGSPFLASNSQTMLSCGEEPIAMKDCPINREWYRDLYGEVGLSKISEQRVLCSGFTMGSSSVITRYLDELCDAVKMLSTSIAWRNGLDQAVHNQILRYGTIANCLNAESADGKIIATMHHVSSKNFSIRDNAITNAAAEKIAVVHQYDRHEEFKNWVNRRYG